MQVFNPSSSALSTTSLVQANEYVRVVQGNQLPVFNRKVGNVTTNNGNARMLIVGDSLTVGLHSTSTVSTNTAWGYGAIAQRYFANAGVTSQRDTVWASGDGTNQAEDSRLVLGSSWATFGSTDTLGGLAYTALTATNALSFTPTGIVDTFIVYYVIASTTGTISVAIDSGSATNQVTTGSPAVGKVTVTATAPGIHTCNIKYVSGSFVSIVGIEAYNSQISQLQVMNAGWGGANTPNIAETFANYAPLPALKFVAPDLTIIATGVNDWAGAVNINTFTTAYQAVITAAKISGDCVALIPPPSNPGQIPQATQDIYANAIRALAASNNIPTIDIYARFVSYSASTGLYFDNLHPNGPGYEVMGKAVFEFLDVWGAGSVNPPTIGIPLLIQTVANNTYTYIGQAGSAGTILGIYEEARTITTAGTFAITINGTNVTGLSAVVPTTAGSYTAASALNTFNRGDKIQIIYSGTTLVVDHTLTLDITQSGAAL